MDPGYRGTENNGSDAQWDRNHGARGTTGPKQWDPGHYVTEKMGSGTLRDRNNGIRGNAGPKTTWQGHRGTDNVTFRDAKWPEIHTNVTFQNANVTFQNRVYQRVSHMSRLEKVRISARKRTMSQMGSRVAACITVSHRMSQMGPRSVLRFREFVLRFCIPCAVSCGICDTSTLKPGLRMAP